VKDRVKVKIPAGVDNGSTIRVSGKGEGGARGGASGDLYINLAVEASKKFVRDGTDIHSEVEVALVQAVLGSEIDVDTLDGMQTIRIPAGTLDGKVFKLSEKGVVRVGGSVRGNHLVKIKVKVPEKLSNVKRIIYRTAKESGIDVKKGGWW
jgi:molecular chaperone DnaJ